MAPLHEQFLAWLGQLRLDSPGFVAAFDVLAVILAIVALWRRAGGYRWWYWPLWAIPVVLGLGLLAALNRNIGTFPTVSDLAAWSR